MCVGIGHGTIHKRRKMRQNTKGKKRRKRGGAFHRKAIGNGTTAPRLQYLPPRGVFLMSDLFKAPFSSGIKWAFGHHPV